MSGINLFDPVNRSHPLNHGRVAWWLAVPGIDGGRQLFDLMGLNPGTLTNMGSASGWRGTTRPGGFGHLLFDKSDDAVRVGTAAQIVPNPAISVAAWVRLSAADASNYQAIVGRWDDSSSSRSWLLCFGPTGGGSTNGLVWFAGVGGGVAFPTSAAAESTFVGRWARCVGTCDGTTMRIFVDGVEAATPVATGGSINSSTVDEIQIGNHTSGTPPFGGAIDDVSVWLRALSPAEVQADYELSRLGYPGVLNRVAVRMFTPATAAATTGLLLRRRRMLAA